MARYTMPAFIALPHVPWRWNRGPCMRSSAAAAPKVCLPWVPLSKLATRGTAWESGNRQALPNLRRLQRSRVPLLLPRRMGRPFCAGRVAVLEAVLEVVLNLHQRVRTRLLRTRDEIRATILQSRIPQHRVAARRIRRARRRMKMTNVPSYAGPTALLGIVPTPRQLRAVRHHP